MLRYAQPPSLFVECGKISWVSTEGEVENLSRPEALERLSRKIPFVCHRPLMARRLGQESMKGLDLLELFAFVFPATFCYPTPKGLADFLKLAPPRTVDDAAASLHRIADALLEALGRYSGAEAKEAWLVADAMEKGIGSSFGWGWAPFIKSALPKIQVQDSERGFQVLNVARHIPEWDDLLLRRASHATPVEPLEARQRLAFLTQAGFQGVSAEERPQQADYASATAAAFSRSSSDQPIVVVAEAGTGVGKTLGYLASATMWAERNEEPVGVATFTRNLQHQVDEELNRLYHDADLKHQRAVIRKGRENYLCLLKLDDAISAIPAQPHHAVALGLMARWVGASRDGDLSGVTFPAWLPEILGYSRTLGLADRRGECVRSACPHYRRCFVEHSISRARGADIVISNHALVMAQAANNDMSDIPQRLIFDEAHRLFDAADSAFSEHLTGSDGAEVRRWIKGAEGSTHRRLRGLRRRLEILTTMYEEASPFVEAIVELSSFLPGEGWHNRLVNKVPQGAYEVFLATIQRHVYAHNPSHQTMYDLEAPIGSPSKEMINTAQDLLVAVKKLLKATQDLILLLKRRLRNEEESHDGEDQRRLEIAIRSLDSWLQKPLNAWREMLIEMSDQNPSGMEGPNGTLTWAFVQKLDGRDVDAGLHHHFIDPLKPFAESLKRHAQGVVMTSATLRDGTGDVEQDWVAAEIGTGGRYFTDDVRRVQVPSPFDYRQQTRVFVVVDLDRDNPVHIAQAYRDLFVASEGGGLGLFTAIHRLKAVYHDIVTEMAQKNIPLYAQHVDDMAPATLIDMFRADQHACLLGTDAVREGVDVPGDSLRLVVLDRVPWPRPTLLHKERRAIFGRQAYDDKIIRSRLRQSFGRLVRRENDRGVFVLLDRRIPSRLLTAFPGGVEIERLSLAEVVTKTKNFLQKSR